MIHDAFVPGEVLLLEVQTVGGLLTSGAQERQDREQF